MWTTCYLCNGTGSIDEKYCIDLDDEYDFLRGEMILKDLIKNE